MFPTLLIPTPAAATSYDPYLSNVILLMHFDGSFADSSSLAQAFTAYGAAANTATNAKFTQSLDVGGPFPNGGGTSRVQSNVARSEYDLGSGDFTLECWFLINGTVSAGNVRALISVHSLSQINYGID